MIKNTNFSSNQIIILSDSEDQAIQINPRKRRKPNIENDDQMIIKFQKKQRNLSQKQKQKQNKQKLEKSEKQLVVPWILKSTQSVEDSLLRFHNEIIDFYNYIKPSHREHKIKLTAFEDIKNIVKNLFPGVQVIAFGSFATQLYLPDGDIDLVVLTNNKYQVSTVYSKINKELEANPTKYCKLQYIRKSKVPLIKFYYNNAQSSDIQFDISVDKTDGISQLNYVKKMTKLYPEFKFLVFVFKCFLKIRGLSETYTGGVGSFLLFCMILAYLQDIHKLNKYYTLGEHVLQFMAYYGETDWSTKVLDLKFGVSKNRRFDDNAAFSFISPQDPTHDIGRAAFKIRQVFKVFKNRSKYISGKNFQKGESILKQLVNPTKQNFRYSKVH